MAAGDLSPDQRRYRDRLVERTGLDQTVVTAWIGSESPWGRSKAGHNYLNIGPGRTYASADQTADAAANLITNSPRYAKIRSAIPGGPEAQIKAIGDSPWGTKGDRLTGVYLQLALKARGNLPTRDKIEIDEYFPNPLDVAGDAAKGAAGFASRFFGLDKLWDNVFVVVMRTGLTIVFTTAALVLIALGLFRLTGTPPRQAFDKASGLAGLAGTARAVAS